MNPRQRALLLALVVALGATWWAATLEQEDAADAVPAAKGRSARSAKPPARAARARAPAGLSQDAALARLEVSPARFGVVENPLLASASFEPPPPPPPPPPKPTAPPLRFKFLGRLDDGDRLAVFLLDGARPVVAREGDLLPGGWRVDKIADTSMTFTFVALEQQQILSFGP